jgi:hypothetical protein
VRRIATIGYRDFEFLLLQARMCYISVFFCYNYFVELLHYYKYIATMSPARGSDEIGFAIFEQIFSPAMFSGKIFFLLQ